MKRIVLGISLLMIAFAAGIQFQRTVTVGKTIRRILSFLGASPDPVVEISTPISGDSDWSGNRDSLDRIELKRIGGGGPSPETAAALQQRATEESRFRESEEVATAYRKLHQAKEDNGITAMEIRRNRFLRKEELDYQRNDGSRDRDWEDRISAIAGFHQHLEARGIHLIFMPVPNQVDIELPALIDAGNYLSSSPEHTEFLSSLAERGIDLIDLRYPFGDRIMEGENMINRFDHHWSPQAVEIGADALAHRIRTKFDGLPENAIARFDYATVYIPEPVINFPHRPGDATGSPLFARQVTVNGEPTGSFADSKIVILGDSMVLVYGPPNSADVGSHLSARLGYPCRVIGRGSGSPLVPRMFLENYGVEKSPADPEVVIWICVSRHQDYAVLDLTDTVPTGKLNPGIHDVTVRRLSVIPDPKTAPYSEAIYAMEATIQPLEGPEMAARIYAPAFESRKLSDTARIETGKRYRMELMTWSEAKRNDPALGKRALINDFDNFSLPEFFWTGGRRAGSE